LGDYLKDALGTEWGNAELLKPFDQRHPILVWYHKLCEQQRLTIKATLNKASKFTVLH
jgi:hypothetical protein